MDIEDRIGVSLISIVGIDVEEAIEVVYEAGFKAIEIFVGDTYFGTVGHPVPKLCASINPQTCDKIQRRIIKDKLQKFSIVTLHVQIVSVNIACFNPGIRQESIRQYFECIELAHDIGASIVTFHPGHSSRGTYGYDQEQEVYKYNVNFAKEAAREAAKYDLKIGYEGISGATWLGPVDEVICEVDDDRFGLLFDPAQSYAALNCDGGAVLNRLEKCKGKIWEVHVHGLLRRVIGLSGHLPLRMNNVVDYPLIMKKLKDLRFSGPFIFEIVSSDNISTVIKDCQESKEMLIRYYEGLV